MNNLIRMGLGSLLADLQEELRSQRAELISMEKDREMPSREYHLTKKKARIAELEQQIRCLV